MTIYLNKPAEEEVEETVEEEEKEPKPAMWYLGFGLGIILVFPLATMLLWNWLMPAIFGLPMIGFFKSLGLLALSYILFKR